MYNYSVKWHFHRGADRPLVYRSSKRGAIKRLTLSEARELVNYGVIKDAALERYLEENVSLDGVHRVKKPVEKGDGSKEMGDGRRDLPMVDHDLYAFLNKRVKKLVDGSLVAGDTRMDGMRVKGEQ
jgi:hypothetical protein